MKTNTQSGTLQTAASQIRRVYSLNMNGARFVEIETAGGSLLSILRMVGEESEAQSLFRAADEETEKARAACKRATLLRKAAWRTIATKASHVPHSETVSA